MGQIVPTPHELAARSLASRERESLGFIMTSIRESFSSSAWAAEQAGNLHEASVQNWMQVAGAAAVADWVDIRTTGFQLASRIKEALVSDRTPLLGRLVQEEHLSRRASTIAPYLRANGQSMEQALLRVRTNIAVSALDAAFETSWERRTIFSRTLQLARSYLAYVLEADELSGRPPSSFLTSKLAMATIFTARFSTVDEEALLTACAALSSAYEDGHETAMTYYLEGCLWLYDSYGSISALVDGAKTIAASTDENRHQANWHLNCADIWMKLAGCASPLARQGFLEKARACLLNVGDVSALTPDTRLAYEMQSAFLKFLQARVDAKASAFSCRGIRFPYALRSPHVSLSEDFYDVADALSTPLRTSSYGGSYIHRDVLAELLSYRAHDPQIQTSEAIDLVLEAISLRRGVGRQTQLHGARIELAQAEDRLFLSSMTAKREPRLSALIYLASDLGEGAVTATRLSVLARNIETEGAFVGPLLPVDAEIAIHIRNGDSKALYAAAARAATMSHDLTRIELGGRGSVIAVRDSDTRTGHTFVFKVLTPLALSRDMEMTSKLDRRLNGASLASRFGVIEHLSTMSLTDAGREETILGEIVSVRRFSSGQTLHDLIKSGDPDLSSRVASTVDYLSFIQAMASPGSDPVGVRRTIRATEVGRWLKTVFPDLDNGEMFELWWECVAIAPVLTRRDAHAMNWLVETGGRILAVDLESIGWRPFGYELAQLTEDTPIFAAEDWSSRNTLVASYAKSLRQLGVDLRSTDAELQYFYGAGTLARVLRTLSISDSMPHERHSAGETLNAISRNFAGTRLGNLAQKLAEAWARKTGLASGDKLIPLVESERRRISRAMAFHLRHDESAPLSNDAWIHVDELAALLNANGHKVTTSQLLLIAGALGEPRFELGPEGEDIRAAYGHSSMRAQPSYDAKRPPDRLYHATPLRNLPSILEARDGLRKGERRWVHMTDSISVALTASQRQRQPVVVLSIETTKVEGLVHASGSTWLAPRVPVDALSLLALRDQADASPLHTPSSST